MGDKWSKLKTPKLVGSRNITAPQELSTYSQFDYPIFCFKYLHSGEFGVENCEDNELAAFTKRLQKLSQMTWQQISTAQRHGLGWEKITQNAIKAGIPKHVTPDTDFIAFRFLGRAPFVGYRNLAILHVLYIDAKFKLYNH
jgi:hypothetical protein